MVILSIDLGKTYGWCCLDGDECESGYGQYVDIVDWGRIFEELLDRWKPEMIVISQTNNFGFFHAMRMALLQTGVCFYLCGKRGITGVELNDTTARKAVIGKALKKKEVQEEFKDMNMQPDELDAWVLAWGWKKLNEE